LFKAISASSGLGVDPYSRVGEIGAELADVLFLLLAITNRCGVDLPNAARDRDRENSKRIWQKAPSGT
jgi:NTP pyrophosphatase (non-canonical NTP hydrolase)